PSAPGGGGVQPCDLVPSTPARAIQVALLTSTRTQFCLLSPCALCIFQISLRSPRHTAARSQQRQLGRAATLSDGQEGIMRSDRMEVAVLKGQIRTERSVHFLDIRRLEAGGENRASLQISTGEVLQFICTLEADLIKLVSHLVASLQFHLPQLRTTQQQLLDLRLPKSWDLESLVEAHKVELGRPGSDKCGHFGSAYEFFCRYTGAEVREEIRWDVETIYFSQGSRTFNMTDFSHFGPADFAIILASLSFNDYFTALHVEGIKFTAQMSKFLEMMLTYNTTLLELHLPNCGLKIDSVRAIASALDANSGFRIKVLDLSGNTFSDDKIVDRLCALLSRLSSSLERLVLSGCGLSAKALNRVCEALGGGQQGLPGPPPLSHLVIDCNEQKGENSTLIQKYISKATNLEHLSCVGCDFNLDSQGLGPALLRCLRLRLLRLNSCRLPPQAISDLLSGLGSNKDLKGVRLELASNEFGVAGAHTLESLSLRDSRLRDKIVVLLNAIGQCRNLSKLDISGNWMQDLGAKFLAKSLYLNSSLTEVRLDDNHIGLSGLRDITEALQFNSSLCSMPVPAMDIARILADPSAASSVNAALASLQQALLKNHSATYQVTGRDYRLQSELGSYAFSLDHLASRLDHSLKAIDKSDPDPEVAECEQRCRAAMRDALSARYLLTGLSGVADSWPAESISHCVRKQLAQPLLDAASADLGGTQEAMLQFLEAECPNAFKADPSLAATLRNRLASEQSQFSAASVLTLLERSAMASVASKLTALQLNSALLINDCMQEAIGHNLQMAEQTLSKLMRSKMLKPNLRRNESQKTSESDAADSQSPKTPEPQSLHNDGRRNTRPISVFGKKGSAKITELIEISVDEGKADGSDADKQRSLQALPRRPVGNQNRRLPTSNLLRQRQSEEAKEKEDSEPEPDEEIDVDLEADPVFEQRDADEPKQPPPAAATQGAARKLPVGAVPLMGFGAPPPHVQQKLLARPEEESSAASSPSTPPARVRLLPAGSTPMAISKDDLAKSVLRKAESEQQPPPATAPKPKPKTGTKPPASNDSGTAAPAARTSVIIDGKSSPRLEEHDDRKLKSLPTEKSKSKP
uniref:Carm_PH domain-containing protein n=1 Tax=Macrostomum lignano TaxID=282301 RepID=A0A1I8G7W5_9PLAT